MQDVYLLLMLMIVSALLGVLFGVLDHKTPYSVDRWAALSIVTLLISMVSLIALVVVACSLNSAVAKARVLNREYGTNYTYNEVYYASDVINTIRELDRSRSEITLKQ